MSMCCGRGCDDCPLMGSEIVRETQEEILVKPHYDLEEEDADV